MSNDQKAGYEKVQGWLQAIRDFAILVVLASLLLFPSFVNNRLTRAGFTKASIAGFEWESALQTAAQQTKEATQTITNLEKQLQDSRAQLAQLQASASLPPDAREQVAKLSRKIENTTEETTLAKEKLQRSLGAQQAIVQQVQASKSAAAARRD